MRSLAAVNLMNRKDGADSPGRDLVPENEFRYGAVEFRQNDDGLGMVVGTVIRYGDVATLPWGTEEFKAGAFENVESADLIANRMHQRTQPIARTWRGPQCR